jgi:hypothetical protein
MASLQRLNPRAEFAARDQALAVNINASQGLQNVLKSNLGPKGTLKMYAPPRYISHHFCMLTGPAGMIVQAGLWRR